MIFAKDVTTAYLHNDLDLQNLNELSIISSLLLPFY